MELNNILSHSLESGASDVHITFGVPVIFRIDGRLRPISEKVLTNDDCRVLVYSLLSKREREVLEEKGEVDTAYALPSGARFRVNAYKQKKFLSAALRAISDKIPTLQDLNLPAVLADLCRKQRGLILVTGPTGSGKSTTLAAMIGFMNRSFNHHIITIEDPIEYVHKHGTCIINQRQIGQDSLSFSSALRAALRQDPDVILVGEMRDEETISIALTAAETGHLVMSTLHTIGAAKTIDRITDTFSPAQQQQIKAQLSSVIEAVISQQIIPRSDGKGRVAAVEIMISNTAIRNLVREGKTHQIQNIIQTSITEQMETMDSSLIDLYRKGTIDKNNLYRYAVDNEFVRREINDY